MSKAIETRIKAPIGLQLNQAIYPNKNGNYSPIVLEIGQIRERGLWANDPLITTQDTNKKEQYLEFFDRFYKMPLLKNFRLFEKRLYRWGWVGLVIRFYGDKAKYTLDFETRKVESVDVDLDTNEIRGVQTVWYFTVDGWKYKVLEKWNKDKVTRILIEETTSQNINIGEWNITHPSRQIHDWEHNYGIIPLLVVSNSISENGEVIDGFANALIHINSLDRIDEEIKYETVATRSKTYYDVNAFKHKEVIDNKLVDFKVTEDDIVNSTIIGIQPEAGGFMTGGDSLNDNLKAKVPIFVAQFNRSGVDTLLQQKEKLTTQIYSMLGFTNPNSTIQVVRTATEMEYYNETSASTLKALSLERTNTLHDFIDLIIQIGIKQGYSGFDSSMNIDDLNIKVIPNIKTDEVMFLDYQLKKYEAKLITLPELKEIIDNMDKEAVLEWMKENAKVLISLNDADKIDRLTTAAILDKATLLTILFKGMLDDSEIQAIITKADEERPTNPLTDEFGDILEDDTTPNSNQSNEKDKPTQ